MVLPPPRSQVADAGGLGRAEPICAKAEAVNKRTRAADSTTRFCMISPCGVRYGAALWTIFAGICHQQTHDYASLRAAFTIAAWRYSMRNRKNWSITRP